MISFFQRPCGFSWGLLQTCTLSLSLWPFAALCFLYFRYALCTQVSIYRRILIMIHAGAGTFSFDEVALTGHRSLGIENLWPACATASSLQFSSVQRTRRRRRLKRCSPTTYATSHIGRNSSSCCEQPPKTPEGGEENEGGRRYLPIDRSSFQSVRFPTFPQNGNESMELYVSSGHRREFTVSSC